jgi:hypothetical protein
MRDRSGMLEVWLGGRRVGGDRGALSAATKGGDRQRRSLAIDRPLRARATRRYQKELHNGPLGAAPKPSNRRKWLGFFLLGMST